MNKQDFHFKLPEELIAQTPLARRDESRLMHIDARHQTWAHRQFQDITQILQPGDCLVINDTKVIPARLTGNKASGGQVEIFLERECADSQVLARVRASKPLKPGQSIIISEDCRCEVIEKRDEFYLLQFPKQQPASQVFVEYGKMPLPPYIKRETNVDDVERYQTVFAEKLGAVAAPTAGLHFTDDCLQTLRSNGVAITKITLHVAAGTYQPMRVDEIAKHRMHTEIFAVDQDCCDVIQQTKQRGGRVVAVGTTCVRALESASNPELKPLQGETDIFIYPGYEFKTVDAMITNFHLPESTLMMLVCAFAGKELMLNAYRAAVAERYRFFSYGDAMFIERPL